MNKGTDPPVIALIGPTAVGKTSLSLKLAERFPIEIVSADSRLFYRGLDIGTAKPMLEERQKAIHHLIDVTSANQPWGLADFRLAAREVIDTIHQHGKLPLLVGGTGQYMAAILEGWHPPPRPPSDTIRAELQALAKQHGALALHARLEAVDPVSAGRIDYRNVRRVIRALEIYELTGRPASELRGKQTPPYRILRIGLTLPRKQLYKRIDERLESMLDAGWVEEVKRLIEHGYDFQTPPFSAIGYRQLASYIRGEISIEQAKIEIKRLTRQFVRRQANWFKPNDPQIHWFVNEKEVEGKVIALIKVWLEGSGVLGTT
jgi:tRNA dimethylallyltransferase